MPRPMTYPDPRECPSGIADHIYDIRFGKNTAQTSKAVRSCYGTIEFFLDSVAQVYDANSWILTRKDKALCKKVFLEVPAVPSGS